MKLVKSDATLNLLELKQKVNHVKMLFDFTILDMNHVMRKSRLISAFVVCCIYSITPSCYIRNFKTLASLCL